MSIKCIQVHPTAKTWRTKGFPLYNKILEIVDGIVATGEGTFHAGQPIPLTIQPEPIQERSTSLSSAESDHEGATVADDVDDEVSSRFMFDLCY